MLIAKLASCFLQDALTLRRPCCGKPIAHEAWEGCAAVKCDACPGVQFCGVCLDFSVKGDCHPHARSCAQNTSNNLFPPREVYQTAHRCLARQRVEKLLRPLAGQTRLLRQTLADCERDLRDAGLTVADFLPVGSADGNLVPCGAAVAGSAAPVFCSAAAGLQLPAPMAAAEAAPGPTADAVGRLQRESGLAFDACEAALVAAQGNEALARMLLRDARQRLQQREGAETQLAAPSGRPGTSRGAAAAGSPTGKQGSDNEGRLRCVDLVCFGFAMTACADELRC